MTFMRHLVSVVKCVTNLNSTSDVLCSCVCVRRFDHAEQEQDGSSAASRLADKRCVGCRASDHRVEAAAAESADIEQEKAARKSAVI